MNHSPFIFTHDQCNKRPPTLLGGKAWNLARLESLGQPVPPWYVVSAAAFQAVLHRSGRDRILDAQLRQVDLKAASTTAHRIQKEILAIEFTANLREQFAWAHSRIRSAGNLFSVRSSAAGEDSLNQSFAGIHESFLFVHGLDEVFQCVKNVWASAFSERALAYRLERHLPLTGIAMAVIVQQMIDAAVSGVMFTVDPVSGNVHRLLIHSVLGAGEGLVSQGFDADAFTVDKSTLNMETKIASKPERLIFDRTAGHGLVKSDVPETQQRVASLLPQQVRQLAEAGIAVERAYGHPQDIEFCFDLEGKPYLLQSRPITTAREYGPAAGHHLIWDNSNIIESYSGVTSPMTFSFIRHAYSIVYHCFAEVMGISRATIHANQLVFENMLGLFRGQVYYNLLNWYRLVRLFPGFHYNKKFMESMMGVKEPMELKEETPPTTRFQKYLIELPSLVRLATRSVVNFLRIREWVNSFQKNFDTHYRRWAALDFDRLAPHELMSTYQEMEQRLLWNWKAPIVNDFYVMIFYGVLKRLCQAWCRDTQGSLQNDLICGEGDIESTEPTKRLLSLAAMAQKEPELRDRILHQPAEAIAEEVKSNPRFAAFAAEFQNYLECYGFRCINELKLEEHTLQERPAFLFTVIQNYLTLDRPDAVDIQAIERKEQQIRKQAESRAFEAIRAWPYASWKRMVFQRVLRNARLGVKHRENMRFARTKIYGLVRKLIRALGRHFATEGILQDSEDIFYLTIDECWDFIKGTSVTTRLAHLAELRKKEFEEYRKGATPADRFETYGMAYHKNLFLHLNDQPAQPMDGLLRGTGCCPGEVVNIVKVLKSPADDMKLAGEILVAERTDPGWVPLYPSVSGILIERGSILSHSAIVAREMGIPTIVGIPRLTVVLQTGARVRMDGAAGTVYIIPDTTVESGR